MIKKIRNIMLIRKINKALGFKLNNQQKVYIFENKDVFTNRAQGKTTAHIIKILLFNREVSKGSLRLGAYNDMDLHLRYTKFFEREFYHIMDKLKSKGIKIARITL